MSLLWLANSGVKPPFFKINRLKLQKLLKSCWPSKTESLLRCVICWKNFVRKATSETRPNPRVKVNFTLARSFQKEPCWEMDVMPNANFELFTNIKDQLRNLHNYLNQKVITAINTLDGSTLGDNLITSHQVDHMSSALSILLNFDSKISLE